MSDDKKKISPGLVPVYEVPPEVEISETEVGKLDHNRIFNDIYAEYYDQLAEDAGDEQYNKNAERMRSCHTAWFGDHYILQGVFDVKNVLLCHDRWCANCQHLKQAAQMQRFTKILEEAALDHDLYLMTLTVPNCPTGQLADSLKRFAKAFSKIIRYFTGNSKVYGIDFEYYGFYAAYRNIEIVINPDNYHPHYHAVLALRKDLNQDKLYKNQFSYDYGVFNRKFSELEILLQKILYLGYNDIKITKKAISELKQGYSCTIDKVEDKSWHEAFKYATKLTKNGAPNVLYYQFKELTEVMKNLHVSQGYGAWYKLPEDKFEIDESILAAYEYVVAHLKDVEDPVGYTFDIAEILKNMRDKGMKCISRKKAYKLLAELKEQDKEFEDPFEIVKALRAEKAAAEHDDDLGY